MPIRLRIFSIFLIVFNFELFADEFINGTLVTEVNNNSYDELNETRYKTIDGDFTINLPKNNENTYNILYFKVVVAAHNATKYTPVNAFN